VGETFELVFVDDGSRDRTFYLLKEIAAVDSRVVVVKLGRNFGQTSALAAGFDHARGDYVIAMDGDLQHDPDDIPRFIAKLDEGYDIVSGWRERRADNLFLRRIPSRLANTLIRRICGVDIHDFGTTFKAYRRDVIEHLNLYGDSHRFIPALAAMAGATITEVPIRNINAPYRRSNYGLGRTFRVLLDLLTIAFLHRYLTRPLHLFGKFGLAHGVLAMLVGLFVAVETVRGKPLTGGVGALMLGGAILLMMALVFLSLGLMAELLSRVYFESQRKPVYTVRDLRRGPEVWRGTPGRPGPSPPDGEAGRRAALRGGER
jgi:glycosyltransferase involved in cell wall biosynthesis